ncbi:hypothetical protein ALC152_04430 [Arcobacter sp. 15-2]|uniref:hypothetical protein n=1 Tax=Arcobacter sp. 15-2 TaxID=3374109 RepID=UPI00399D1454
MKEIPTQKDKWQVALDAELLILKKCQLEKSLDSCMKCEHLLECTTRDKYIKVVYESMNKGSGGGFEF